MDKRGYVSLYVSDRAVLIRLKRVAAENDTTVKEVVELALEHLLAIAEELRTAAYEPYLDDLRSLLRMIEETTRASGRLSRGRSPEQPH